MHKTKIGYVLLAVSLLALGCNKNKNTDTPTAAPTGSSVDAAVSADQKAQVAPVGRIVVPGINPSTEVVPTDWIPYEGSGYRFLMPTAWHYKEGRTQESIVISNKENADLTASDAVSMEFQLLTKPAKATLESQLSAKVGGNASNIQSSKADTGLLVYFAPYSEGRNKAVAYVIQKSDTDYMYVLVRGSVTAPQVRQIIQSFALRGNN